jgi:3,4-dihydroxy 2-butanone 4-phosphate synthase/GTP cyclohydrolase II
MAINTIEEILEDLRLGRMVVIMDDEDRENEGDLVMAAERVTPDAINFMARFGRGLICLTLTRDRCRQLRLPLMVSDTDDQHGTNFTLSIEAAEGITTGISAHDRAVTIAAAVKPDARPEDLRQPGHIFPLMAQAGGVLSRAGHTEAGCDLARLSGASEASAVIVEILNEDGTMARRPDLENLAAHHGLKIGTIADLIRYRLDKEPSVERILEQDVKTAFGQWRLYCYDDYVHHNVHLALVKGDLTKQDAPLVRVHLPDTLRDVVGVRSPVLGWPLGDAMQWIEQEGAGVVIILRQQEGPRELIDAAGSLQAGTQPKEATGGGTPMLRTYGIGAQILRDLGVHRMRVLSSPKQMHGISGFDLEVVGYVDERHQVAKAAGASD